MKGAKEQLITFNTYKTVCQQGFLKTWFLKIPLNGNLFFDGPQVGQTAERRLRELSDGTF